MASAKSTTKSSDTSKRRPAQRPSSALVGLCLKTRGEVDLDPRSFYKVIPDRVAQANGRIRVVDESGEDYLYPKSYFRVLRFPAAVARQLTARPD